MTEDRRDAHAWLEMLAGLGAAHGTMLAACGLALHAIPRLTCFPSYATLTAKTRLRKSALAEHMRRLEDAGCLAVHPRRGESGKQWNEYGLTWPSDVEAARVAIVGRRHKAGSAPAEADRVPPLRDPASAAAPTGFRRCADRVPPPRKGKYPEGKNKGEGKGRKASPSSQAGKIPRPSDDTPARGNFTGLDVLKRRPTCSKGHAMRLAWNGVPDEGETVGSWYSFCPGGCRGEKFDPVHDGVAKGITADDEQKRRAQERRNPTDRDRESAVYRYPAPNKPAPVGGAVAAALAALEVQP